MAYRNLIAAVVRTLAADNMNDVRNQVWQTMIDPIELRSGHGVLRDERRILDCWMYARLHSALEHEHWQALVARYSTYLEYKLEALAFLLARTESPAPERFRERCVATWAFPRLPGARHGKRSASVLPDAWYDMSNWDDNTRSPRTHQRWASGIREQLERCVDRALIRAQEVFDAEGVLNDHAA